jgi:uncharacterized membrane protein
MSDNEGPVEHTTIIETGGGGSGGIVAVVVLLIIVLGLLFLFRDQLGLTGHKSTAITIPDKIDINVNSH